MFSLGFLSLIMTKAKHFANDDDDDEIWERGIMRKIAGATNVGKTKTFFYQVADSLKDAFLSQ